MRLVVFLIGALSLLGQRTILICEPGTTPSKAIATNNWADPTGCRLVRLGANISIQNGVLVTTSANTGTQRPAAATASRQYGVRLTLVSGAGWTGIPATATNICLWVNGLQQYRDRGDWYMDSSGLVRLPFFAPATEVRADFDQ
jgi:hypothetical protein